MGNLVYSFCIIKNIILINIITTAMLLLLVLVLLLVPVKYCKTWIANISITNSNIINT